MGGNDREIKFLEQFFEVVTLGRIFRWLVDGGDPFQGLAHDFKSSRIHKCQSFRAGIVRPGQPGGKAA